MFIQGMKAALIGVVAAFAALPALAADITVKHAQGETVLPGKPAKIVVFDLVSLDTLKTLGVTGIVGVPSGNKPDYLADFAGGKVPEAGTLFEPNFEAVAAAEPDLIIVGGRSAPKYADLAKIAPTIDMTIDAQRFLASAEDNVRTLATVFGKQTEAETLIGKLNASTAALREKAPAAGKTLFILTTGGKLSAYGAGSRFGLVHSDFNFAPADETIKPGNHGQPVSFEYILERNPDTLLVLDRDAAIGQEADGEAAAKLLDNEIVRQTEAWKNGKVVYVSGVLWYLVPGGLTSMQMVVDELVAALGKG
ncbi:siderophore ABC transporter substrate-binding protein [Allorhizobium borbori]|uniref:Iron complex transport system substrate-binding protein n=1 Tax=Allorhizobium borbori TaxID=485907 RepID=A0A7W6K372_9HYPH|nr:siderophore ABC transporter substrate-binding protein [Allorhizobium borbori]MBB4103232.1 iron complex transport system substrate-binding protein [Allorhizobium borbori]